jgi:hypothetical protein
MINERKTYASYFSRSCRMPEDELQLNGPDIPFVNNAEYLSVIFNRRMTWRLHLKTTVAKAIVSYVRIHSIFKSKHLSANIKLVMYRAIIRLIMTSACSSWDVVADTYQMKLQCLQNRVLCAICKLYRFTLVCNLHMVFNLPYTYDYITKLCQRQAEVILNHQNPNLCASEQGEARHGKYKRLKCGNGQAYNS